MVIEQVLAISWETKPGRGSSCLLLLLEWIAERPSIFIPQRISVHETIIRSARSRFFAKRFICRRGLPDVVMTYDGPLVLNACARWQHVRQSTHMTSDLSRHRRLNCRQMEMSRRRFFKVFKRPETYSTKTSQSETAELSPVKSRPTSEVGSRSGTKKNHSDILPIPPTLQVGQWRH